MIRDIRDAIIDIRDDVSTSPLDVRPKIRLYVCHVMRCSMQEKLLMVLSQSVNKADPGEMGVLFLD